MTSATYDLTFLKAAGQELKAYLLSDELFWATGLRDLSGEPPFPQLTLGNLRLSQARLEGRARAGALQAEGQAEFGRLEAEIEARHERWRVAWEGKAGWEFKSRLRQWDRYLEELADDRPRHASFYPSEVRLRALLELLKGDLAPNSGELLDLLAGLDRRLRGQLKRGEFLWDGEVAPAFPPQDYWFLYGDVKVD